MTAPPAAFLCAASRGWAVGRIATSTVLREDAHRQLPKEVFVLMSHLLGPHELWCFTRTVTELWDFCKCLGMEHTPPCLTLLQIHVHLDTRACL